MATNLSQNESNEYKVSVLLRDGSTVQIRPLRLDDEDKIQTLFYRLNPSNAFPRFHHVLTQMSKEEAKRFCTVDYVNTFALVATLVEGEQEKIVAIAHYSRLPKGDTAEVSFVVEDAYQGKGIATLLLEHLSDIARQRDIHMFQGQVLAENQAMMELLEESGFELKRELIDNVYHVFINIAPSQTTEERSAQREKTATVASLRAFLKPHSIAVIGASRREGSIGNKLFRNVLHQGFAGAVYPVNPTSDVVASVKAYPTVLDIPGEIDLAVIIVPAPLVQHTVQQCGQKGVRGVVIISAGFGETGPEGTQMQAAVLETAQSYGMRLIGPNCMGVINTDVNVSMNATFSSVFPPVGNIAFCSQSGALGLAILEYAQNLNIGLSDFVSIGNRADVSSNDLMQYWLDDPATDVMLLYMESFGNPRKFARIARSVTTSKPVVVVKSGRTPAGSRAAASHTGALATTEATADALFDQAGIIRVDTLEELFDVAGFLSHQPLPQGRRVAILTNGGGPGILTADACAARGLELPDLSENTLSAMKAILPKGSGLANPIDMTAEASAEQYHQALKLLAEDANVDIVIVIFIPPILTQPEAVARAITDVSPLFRQKNKPMVASFMGVRGASLQLGTPQEGYVPSFLFPESTAIAIAKACDYHDWLEKPKGSIPEFGDIDNTRAVQIIQTALSENKDRPFWLNARASADLLDCYGIRTAHLKSAGTASEAAQIASEIGFPVSVKLLSPTIVHKTEVGGVALNLGSKMEVEQAFNSISQRLEALGRKDEMAGVVVQEMIPDGIEIIVGVTQDPSFGPLILFGMGGIYTELFEDVTFRIHPLTDADASEMVRSVKAYRLLKGWRGAKAADIPALENLLLRISTMVEDFPQIAELDLNPVKVLDDGKGYAVVDLRIMLS